jgi:hypothetical protein
VGVHGLIGELVGFFVVFAADVGDGELRDEGNPTDGGVI